MSHHHWHGGWRTANHQAIEEMLPLIKGYLAVLDDLKKVMT